MPFGPAGAPPAIGPIPGHPVETADIMADPGVRLTPQEALFQGVGKAHRGVCYAHFDFRNFNHTTHKLNQGRVR